MYGEGDPLMRGFALLALGFMACTNVPLERLPKPPPPPVDNLISIKGRFCTEKPETVEFPVKILFVVDVSDSMSVTDPPDPADNNLTARSRAVIDVINTLAGVPVSASPPARDSRRTSAVPRASGEPARSGRWPMPST